MVYTFKCDSDDAVSISLETADEHIKINMSDSQLKDQKTIWLNETELFNFIGAALRIQSEIKKGGNNGNK